mgnify:CR=1 FL=1
MKIIVYGEKETEKGYVKTWAEAHHCEVEATDKPLTPETVGMTRGADGISIQQTGPLANAVYAKLAENGIKQISSRTVGVDMIDLKAAKANQLHVTNVPVYSPRAIAEMGVAHAFYLLRHIGDYQARMAQNDFSWTKSTISNEIYRLTVGVVGLGNIGGATAQLYKALGANVLAYDVFHNVEYEPFVTYTDLDTVLRESDIISLHTPLLPATKNMIGKAQFHEMKDTAFLINMARGGLVDSKALIEALENHEIAGAGLDTLSDEAGYFGKDANSAKTTPIYQKLAKMSNVLLTPHVAFFTETSVKNMVDISLDDVSTIVSGKRTRNMIC